MKKTVLFLLVVLMLLPAALFAGGGKEKAGEGYPPEMDAWAKDAKLGKYDKKQDWDDIIEKAKQEGSVIVYSSSSRIGNAGVEFSKIYPEITVESFDLGSVKTFEKTIQEQDAGLFNADIITTGGSGNYYFELLKKNRVVNFVPSTHADKIPKELQEPLLVRINEAIVFMYNTENHDSQPINNLWELTTEKYRGKVVIKNPLASLSNLMGVATIVQHADEMNKAYESFAGGQLVLSEGVSDAGYEWLYRLIHNDLVILKSGGKVAKASGQKGQENAPVSIGPIAYGARYNRNKGYVNGLIYPVKPADGVIYPTYMSIARQAPHPNAAKLFTAYLLGNVDVTSDTKIEEPYTEGESVKWLQGMAPYYFAGAMSPMENMPIAGDVKDWNKMDMWTVDPEFMWYEGPKVQDFWMKETAE
jgi:iron(III) transport system substrate-binding protein